jgi:hypothetical protein
MSLDQTPLDKARAIIVEEFMRIRGPSSTGESFQAQLAIFNRLRGDGEPGLAELFSIYDSMCMSAQPPRSNVTYNIGHSTIGNAVFDSEVHSITANVNAVSQREASGAEFASAMKQLTNAVAATDELGDAEKKGILEAFELVSSQAKESPEERKMTILKPVLDSLPKLLGAATSLVSLWSSLGPHILNLFK